VLVVPAGKISTEYLATANQDMTVMARILRNALGQAQPAGMDFDDRYGLGGIFVGQNSQNMQNIYLQGFGALFTMKVNFPLAPGPDEEENTPQEQADPDVDPVWQDTQRAIFDPEGARRRRETDEQVVKYDAEKVEKLKTSLIAALKHAVNIRCLAPEEVVVITVSGEAVRGDIVSMQTLPGANSILVTTKDGKTKIYRGALPEEMNVLTPTALTFRAKVSDIKAYAERNMTVESFRQKVQIIDHPQLDTANGNTVTTSITTGYRK
jgi:hypothetical protein